MNLAGVGYGLERIYVDVMKHSCSWVSVPGADTANTSAQQYVWGDGQPIIQNASGNLLQVCCIPQQSGLVEMLQHLVHIVRVFCVFTLAPLLKLSLLLRNRSELDSLSCTGRSTAGGGEADAPGFMPTCCVGTVLFSPCDHCFHPCIDRALGIILFLYSSK